MNLHHYHHIVFDGPLNITVRSDVATEAMARIEAKLTHLAALLVDQQTKPLSVPPETKPEKTQ